MLPFPIQVQLPFPFDSFGSLMFVLSIAATFGLRYARNRTSTLVIQKFHIAVEPLPTANPTVEIVGRMQGLLAFLLGLLGFSPVIRFTISGSELRCQSTSLFGQRSQFIPLRCVSTMAAGIHKPISAVVWAGFVVMFGSYSSTAMGSWIPFIVALAAALMLVVRYVLSKKFFIEVYAQGGPPISLLFQPNVLEGVPIDVDQALKVVDVIRDLILNEGSATPGFPARTSPPPTKVPAYVEAPYEASAWASPSSDAADDDEEQARKLLAQARQFVLNGDKPRAVAILQEIIRRFPRTETADQARRNLQKRGN